MSTMNHPLKYFLILSFAFFAVTGLALGYLASYFLLRTVAYLSPWLPVWMWYANIGLFVHAIAAAAIGTFGVISVLANKSHALKLCTYLLMGLLLIHIGITVQLCTRKSSLNNALQGDLKEAMAISQSNYSLNLSDTQMWDEIQLEVNCCGVKSYKDWFSTLYGNGTSVPDSCCLLINDGCGKDIATKTEPEDEIITKGCLPTLMLSIREDFNYYGYTVWLPVLALQSVLVLLIIYLVHRINMAPSYYPYFITLPSTVPQSLLDSSPPKYKPLQGSL